jgi:hypothetical protein
MAYLIQDNAREVAMMEQPNRCFHSYVCRLILHEENCTHIECPYYFNDGKKGAAQQEARR